jgi:hypothetical protein
VLDNLILPVLEDFRPDIVSTPRPRQHYSDPLANMASPPGLCVAGRQLKADIAVRGRVSIEDALPYVNTGIILAMGGSTTAGGEPDHRRRPRGLSTPRAYLRTWW